MASTTGIKCVLVFNFKPNATDPSSPAPDAVRDFILDAKAQPACRLTGFSVKFDYEKSVIFTDVWDSMAAFINWSKTAAAKEKYEKLAEHLVLPGFGFCTRLIYATQPSTTQSSPTQPSTTEPTTTQPPTTMTTANAIIGNPTNNPFNFNLTNMNPMNFNPTIGDATTAPILGPSFCYFNLSALGSTKLQLKLIK